MSFSTLRAAAWVASLPWLGTTALAADASAATPTKDLPMQIQSSYPVIVTDRLMQARDFYVQRLGFEPVFEATWFVYMASGTTGIAFMSSDHPSQPPGPEKFSGQGLFLTLQVADAASAFKHLKDAGASIAYPVRDEPWGQRRFGLIDPTGMWVDVVEQIAPTPGYWDKYMR